MGSVFAIAFLCYRGECFRYCVSLLLWGVFSFVIVGSVSLLCFFVIVGSGFVIVFLSLALFLKKVGGCLHVVRCLRYCSGFRNADCAT